MSTKIEKSGKIGLIEAYDVADHETAYVLARLNASLRIALEHEPDVIVTEMVRTNGQWNIRVLIDWELAALPL